LLYWYCKWPLQQKKKRKEEAYPSKAGASSGHTTNLEQSILRLSISMVILGAKAKILTVKGSNQPISPPPVIIQDAFIQDA
jgi:hypothetical protein